MSNRSYHLRFSRYFLLVLCMLSAGSCICLLVAAIPCNIKWLFGGGIIFYCSYSIRTVVVAFYYKGNNRWQLLLRDGSSLMAVLGNNSIVTRYVMILNFRAIDNNRKYSLAIWPDSLPPNELRRLRYQINLLRPEQVYDLMR